MTARRQTLGKWLKLTGLALIGLCSVSIPLTIALLLSATGSSDLLTIGKHKPTRRHETPAAAVARTRCVATRGYYALTFEDGPEAAITPRLVAALERSRAVATFFDVGRQAEANPALVELQRTVGQVASHTYSHPHMPQLSSARRVQEIQSAAEVLDYPNAFVRLPYDETSQAVDEDVRRSGLEPVYWTIDAGDPALARGAMVSRALTLRPGGILRLREGTPGTIEALPAIVAGLRERGMCPGFLAATTQTVVGPGGVRFHVAAEKP